MRTSELVIQSRSFLRQPGRPAARTGRRHSIRPCCRHDVERSGHTARRSVRLWERRARVVFSRLQSSSACGQLIFDGDQFGDLGRDDRHRIVRRVQPVSGGEQGADLPEVFVGRLVHDRDQ